MLPKLCRTQQLAEYLAVFLGLALASTCIQIAQRVHKSSKPNAATLEKLSGGKTGSKCASRHKTQSISEILNISAIKSLNQH